MDTTRTDARDWRKPVIFLIIVFGSILFLIALRGAGQDTVGENPVAAGKAAGSPGTYAPSQQGVESRRTSSAPDFNLALFDGGKLALSDLQGQPVVLNFWASWCLPCRDEMPGLERVWRGYKDKGVVFVGVNIQDDEKDARAFLKQLDVTYSVGRDATNKIPISYAVTGLPSTFFISKEGKVARRWVGDISEKQLIAFIEELL